MDLPTVIEAQGLQLWGKQDPCTQEACIQEGGDCESNNKQVNILAGETCFEESQIAIQERD